MGTTRVISFLESGRTVIFHRSLRPSIPFAEVTDPPVTLRTWSLTSALLAEIASLKANRKVKSSLPLCVPARPEFRRQRRGRRRYRIAGQRFLVAGVVGEAHLYFYAWPASPDTTV